MGRLEKIVVLTVLFLVAVILAVSLNREEVVAGPLDPLAGAPEAATGELEVLPAPEQDPRLLSAQVETPLAVDGATAPVTPAVSTEPSIAPAGSAPAAPLQPEPAPGATQPLLRTHEGLAPSLVPEMRLYVWQAGDTFTALADRYYGSRLEVARLRDANEGRDESAIQPGESIFVPAEPVAAAERLGRSSADAGQQLGGVYVVQSGDMLSKIAQRTYGSAGQWRRIYDANRDVLASPDALKVGMRLRIPAE
jgi:nucleoid-associated protein YgaU